MDPYKLQEVSVGLSIIDYLALKGLAKAKGTSLSHVIRRAVHVLMVRYQDTHGALFEETGWSLLIAERDDEELSIPAFDPLTTDEVDVMATEIERLMATLAEEAALQETEERLKCTINVSLSSEVVQSIHRLYKRRIFVSQSEFLRAAIRDLLHEYVFPYMTASASRSWLHLCTVPIVAESRGKQACGATEEELTCQS